MFHCCYYQHTVYNIYNDYKAQIIYCSPKAAANIRHTSSSTNSIMNMIMKAKPV